MFEELLYRSLLIYATRELLPDWGVILLNGIVFAFLHHLYGNPGPDNQIAGFMLAWVFLRSRSVLVPMAMHSAGNGIMVAVHLLYWLFQPADFD